MRIVAYLVPLLAILIISGCAKTPMSLSTSVSPLQIEELAEAIQSLGPDVDPVEAQRAAHIAYNYPLQLAQEYQITDHPLIHNVKVNRGTRPRGLCWHWAQDMETRLAQKQCQTLDLHRAIGNSEVALRIDHSTVIISAKGDTMNQGLVLDPWRYGGKLFWGEPLADTKYQWIPRAQVFELKRQRRLAREGVAS